MFFNAPKRAKNGVPKMHNPTATSSSWSWKKTLVSLIILAVLVAAFGFFFFGSLRGCQTTPPAPPSPTISEEELLRELSPNTSSPSSRIQLNFSPPIVTNPDINDLIRKLKGGGTVGGSSSQEEAPIPLPPLQYQQNSSDMSDLERANALGSPWERAANFSLMFWGFWIAFALWLIPLNKAPWLGTIGEVLIAIVIGAAIAAWTFLVHAATGSMPLWVWAINAFGAPLLVYPTYFMAHEPKWIWKAGAIGLGVLIALFAGAYLIFRYSPLAWWL
jgi:hypothetical protein